MNSTDKTIEFLGGEATVTAVDRDEVVIVNNDPIVINNIPVEFRIWLRKNTADKWVGRNVFAYRVDPDRPAYFPQAPATENQKGKLYRAAVEAAEAIEDELLHAGAVSKARREMQYAAAEHEETRKRLVEATQAYEALLAESIV